MYTNYKNLTRHQVNFDMAKIRKRHILAFRISGGQHILKTKFGLELDHSCIIPRLLALWNSYHWVQNYMLYVKDHTFTDMY